MGFWSWLIGEDEIEQRAEPTQEVTPPVSDVLLKALLNNEVITREKALTLPAVSGAVDFISNTIASMPVKLYKTKQGKVEELTDDTRMRLLNGDTGDTLDAFQMKKAMVMDYLLGKGGYCYIERNRNEVVALRYVEDIYITILKNFKPIFKDYVICVEGKEYEPYDFIKLLRNTKDGASGVGLTVEVSKALETAYQTLLYQLTLVQSGGNKKGFLKSQRKLGQEEINALKKAWANMYANNSENVVVLNNGLEFQEASNSSVEMQLDQNKNTLRDEINNIFHIYPDDFLRTFKEGIYPILKAFETALNRDLLLEKEKKNHFFEFDIKETVRANLQERYQAYKLAKETGFMTLNEIRKAENMEYVEGLDVVNVGLGAVLYDINSHKYYTPNTDTTGDPNDDVNGTPSESSSEEMDKMLENHELAEAYDESGNSAERDIEERYNDVHGKDGRFGSKGGSGGGGDSSGGGSGGGGDSKGGMTEAEKEARIKELEQKMQEPIGLLAKAQIKTELDMLKEGFNGTKEEYLEKKNKEHEEAVKKSLEKKAEKEAQEKAKAEAEEKAKKKQIEEEMKTQPKEKVEQYKIIQENNPMNDDYHVGIRKPSDIKTWDEVVSEGSNGGESFSWGDFTEADAKKALKTGKITIYSSYPISQGTFVSTSKIQAQQYAGGAGKKVYSMTIPLSEVAWINGDEGQFAKRAIEERYNDAHDGKTGRFAPKGGGGSGGFEGTGAGKKFKTAEEFEQDLTDYNDPRLKEYSDTLREEQHYNQGLKKNLDRAISEDGYDAVNDVIKSELKETKKALEKIPKEKTPTQLAKEEALKDRIQILEDLQGRKGESGSGRIYSEIAQTKGGEKE
jgi:HK97 family phage portal protein